MTNSLSAFDQTPNQLFPEPATSSDITATYNKPKNGSGNQVPSGTPLYNHSSFGWTELNRSQMPSSTAVITSATPDQLLTSRTHLAMARQPLAGLLRNQRSAERDRKYAEAMLWLSENRRNYVGQWVALQGAVLVASGKTAKEV